MASTTQTASPLEETDAPNATVGAGLAYQAQHSPMSLSEGLAEYFRENPGLMDPAELPRDLAIGLHAHDVAHVVFGCDTTLVGEVTLARWSLLGITGSIRPYLTGLRRRETRGLFSDAFAQFRPSLLWRMIRAASLAIFRSLRMRERWPYEGYELYLDQPLGEIRKRFGIRVIGAL